MIIVRKASSWDPFADTATAVRWEDAAKLDGHRGWKLMKSLVSPVGGTVEVLYWKKENGRLAKVSTFTTNELLEVYISGDLEPKHLRFLVATGEDWTAAVSSAIEKVEADLRKLEEIKALGVWESLLKGEER